MMNTSKDYLKRNQTCFSIKSGIISLFGKAAAFPHSSFGSWCLIDLACRTTNLCHTKSGTPSDRKADCNHRPIMQINGLSNDGSKI